MLIIQADATPGCSSGMCNFPNQSKAQVIYDGDCQFCGYWVEYWKKINPGNLSFVPFQQASKSYPEVTDFHQYLYFIQGNTHYKGAAAAFAILYLANKPLWLKAYLRCTIFKSCADNIYRLVANSRRTSLGVCRFLWGSKLLTESYEHTVTWFLRGLGLIYLCAFASLIPQIHGLIGTSGILPVHEYLEFATAQFGAERFLSLPTALWLKPDNLGLTVVLWSGVLSSLLIIVQKYTQFGLLIAYILYLSVVNVGQYFTQYQWDMLLLEAGFLALFFRSNPRLALWLFRWLLFRFMFMSGAVKLLSGDATWWDLTALTYHFETQPLPTILAWYTHQLPLWILKASTIAVFFIEMVVPFLIFMPRRLRIFAAVLILMLQVCILLTGNYNFFNLLVILLCLLLLDDNSLTRVKMPDKKGTATSPQTSTWFLNSAVAWLQYLLLGTLFTISLLTVQYSFSGKIPAFIEPVIIKIAPLHVVNSYGVFATMTKSRQEIVFEGSYDGIDWRAYQLKYQVTEADQILRWVIPHQPRLEWQLWFAALSNYEQSKWLRSVLVGLVFNGQDILSLFSHNPFPDSPPTHIRARLVKLKFTDAQTRKLSGHWWVTEPGELYAGPLKLTISATPLK